MNRILHRITAIIGGLAFSMVFMLAGLDTVSMPRLGVPVSPT